MTVVKNLHDKLTEEEIKAELIKTRSLLEYCFEEEITDENIRRFIFGKYGYSSKAIKETNNFPKYFKNILILAYFFVFACYLRDLNEGYGDLSDNAGVKGHVALRVKRYLEDTLVTNPITMSLIEFVLSDVQTDLSLGEKSELKAMLFNLGSFDDGFSLQPYLKAISEYEVMPNRFKASKLEMTYLLHQLVDSLTFLKKYNLVEDGPGMFRFISDTYIKKQKLNIALSESERYDELPVNHLFFCDDKNKDTIFRLYSIETGEKGEGKNIQNIIRLRYVAATSNQTRMFVVPDEEGTSHLSGCKPIRLFEDIVAFPWDAHKSLRTADMDNMSISHIHTVNYKYLKPMALAISDVLSINNEAKKQLYNRFFKIYPYIFENKKGAQLSQIGMEEYELLDWDSIIIMLLIEASPTIVLETITRINRDLFYQICHDLCKRVYDAENLSIFKGKDDKIKAAIDEIIEKKLILSKGSNLSKLSENQMRDSLFPKAAAMLLLSKLNDLPNDDIEEKLVYTGNIETYISLLNKIKDEPDPEKQIKYACMILGETLKYVLCFYSGLIEYGKKKFSYDSKNRHKPLTDREIEKEQKNLERIFLEAARAEAEQLSAEHTSDPSATMTMLDRFLGLCQKCARVENSGKSQYLVIAVGRFEIIDTTRFSVLVQQLRNIGDDSTQESANKWIDITLEILEYFKTGSARGISMDRDLLNAVYPFIVAFNKGRENPDGYKTITFSLNLESDEHDKEKEINVLSEFKYDHNETFYCLPNVIRSNYKWWIDPVLISFRDFNHIFSDIRKEEEE